jgi:hypothetical protein
MSFRQDIRRAIKNHAVFRVGTVIASRPGNSYDIREKGRGEIFRGVPGDNQEYLVGSAVKIAFVEGDPQKPQIIGFAAFEQGGEMVEVEA